MTLYKILVDGKSCHGGTAEWPLPTTGGPGDWLRIDGELSMCSRGIHLTDDPATWWKYGCKIYEAEAEDIRETMAREHKTLCRGARLLREITDAGELGALRICIAGDHRITSGSVIAYGSASVIAYGSASVRAYGSASVRAYGSASVIAYGSASVRAYGSASVRAYDSASVRAYDSASVIAYDSASVIASGSASVIASGSASVEAYDSASVIASGSASVRAYGSASVIASGSASVRAYGSASVRAYGSASVRSAVGQCTLVVFGGDISAIDLRDNAVIVDRRSGRPVITVAQQVSPC